MNHLSFSGAFLKMDLDRRGIWLQCFLHGLFSPHWLMWLPFSLFLVLPPSGMLLLATRVVLLIPYLLSSSASTMVCRGLC